MDLTDKVLERYEKYLFGEAIVFTDEIKDTVVSLADAFSEQDVVDFDIDYGAHYRAVNLIFLLNITEGEEPISFRVRREVGKDFVAFAIGDKNGVAFYMNVDDIEDFKNRVNNFVDKAREENNKRKIVSAFDSCVGENKGLLYDDALKVVGEIADAFKLYDITKASAEYNAENGDISLTISTDALSFLITTEATDNEGTLNFTGIKDGDVLFMGSDKIEEFGAHLREFIKKIDNNEIQTD